MTPASLSAMSPDRVAAAARMFLPVLCERVRLYADAIASAMAREQQLVAWDSEQTIGHLQQRLERLKSLRAGSSIQSGGGGSSRVLERAALPLEGVDRAWEELLKGRVVRVEYEREACSASIELLRGMVRVFEMNLGARPLEVADEPFEGDAPSAESGWAGVFMPGPRVALIEASADRELAAYVLARTSLRRAGTDPRAIKHAYVVRSDERFLRHLTRLWVGVEMGPAGASSSFAGPVAASVADAFARAYEAWSSHPDVQLLCPGGTVERSADRGLYLAPALFAAEWPGPQLPLPGPMLVVLRSTSEQARAGAETALREGRQVVALGVRPQELQGNVRVIQGALLTDRLPPGLPEPRPV